MVSLLTIIHPLVDACSVSVLVSGGVTWEKVLCYNAIAFAMQFPLGIFFDAYPMLVRGGFGISIISTLMGVGACAFEIGGCLSLVFACLGNAMFHLCAGKSVLDASGGKGGPVGLFISTGAIGLFVGMKLATTYALWCSVGFGISLAVLGFLAWRKNAFAVSRPVFLSVRNIAGWVLLGGLFALVVWRSWTGMLAGGMTSSASFFFASAGAVVTWAGKAVGGYVGDRYGRWMTIVVSAIGSVALCFAFSPQQMVAWLVLLFVAQLATGPVLSLMYDQTGKAGGTSFGLNCLGLFCGGA